MKSSTQDNDGFRMPFPRTSKTIANAKLLKSKIDLAR